MKTSIWLSAFLLFVGCGVINSQQPKGITSLSAKEFALVVANKGGQLLDVRTPEEFAEGHLQGAVLANVRDSIAFEGAVLKLDTTKQVLVYCRSGKRSMHAAQILVNKGFSVINLKGGITEWKDAGLLIVK